MTIVAGVPGPAQEPAPSGLGAGTGAARRAEPLDPRGHRSAAAPSPPEPMAAFGSMLECVLEGQRTAVVESVERIADQLGSQKSGGSVRPKVNSTIRVEPKMTWPELGDRRRSPEEAEDFVRAFEGICQMANNIEGMMPAEIVRAPGNCLKGNWKMIYENVMLDAVEDNC